MEIPYKSVEKRILIEMLKEIVTRDGTDYGQEEKTTEQKVSVALGQLEQGKACLFWDAESETVSLHAVNDKPVG